MKFGHKLQALRYEPWARHYLDYDGLKDVLEEQERTEHWIEIMDASAHRISAEFVRLLDKQVERVVLFLLEQEGIVAEQLQEILNELEELENDPEDAQRINQVSQQCYETAALLLRVIQFQELNVTGLRKILKKHDKRMIRPNKLSTTYLSCETGQSTERLAPLLQDHGVAALVLSLESAFWELTLHTNPQTAVAPSNGTGRGRHMRSHTAPVLPPMELPPSPRNIMATPPTVASQDRKRLLGSARQLLSLESNIHSKIFGLLLKISAARRRLQQSSNFVDFLAAPMMVEPESPDGSVRYDSEEEQDEETQALLLEEAYMPSRFSNLLNLLSTFLYMTNYYVVAPAASSYASKLGSDPAYSGLIIGATPVAALVSTLLYSWWTSHSYKAALLFASTCSLLGNVLYALGLPYNSLTLVLMGRLLNGFGSARSINRRYIADSFSKQDRTAASAAFVTAGALGMAAGPALASFLHLTVLDKMNVYWQVENSPGWFMAGVWLVFLGCLLVYFEDPPKKRTFSSPTKPQPKQLELTGEERPLLGKRNGYGANDTPSSSFLQESTAWRRIPVLVTFFTYFVLKLVLESSLSSAAQLTAYYFNWSSSLSGIYLATLGLLMLPANLGVAYLARSYDDRELIVGMQVLLLLGCLMVMKYSDLYTAVQYVTGSVAIFVGANALEGPNMSLLSKTIPKSWSHGFFNVGLLSTEAGTLGRAIGDVLLTVCGAGSFDQMLNSVFGIMSVLSAISLGLTYRFFDYLEPPDKDD